MTNQRLKHRNVFITVLEAVSTKIKVLVGLDSSEGMMSTRLCSLFPAAEGTGVLTIFAQDHCCWQTDTALVWRSILPVYPLCVQFLCRMKIPFGFVTKQMTPCYICHNPPWGQNPIKSLRRHLDPPPRNILSRFSVIYSETILVTRHQPMC